jgi:hypothetical protein
MSEQDIDRQTEGNQGNALQSQSSTPPYQQPLGQQPQGQETEGQSDKQAEGVIPKAAELAEKAVDKGLEKTSGVVGTTIDKVADAAISVLGGQPKKESGPEGQVGGL